MVDPAATCTEARRLVYTPFSIRVVAGWQVNSESALLVGRRASLDVLTRVGRAQDEHRCVLYRRDVAVAARESRDAAIRDEGTDQPSRRLVPRRSSASAEAAPRQHPAQPRD